MFGSTFKKNVKERGGDFWLHWHFLVVQAGNYQTGSFSDQRVLNAKLYLISLMIILCCGSY